MERIIILENLSWFDESGICYYLSSLMPLLCEPHNCRYAIKVLFVTERHKDPYVDELLEELYDNNCVRDGFTKEDFELLWAAAEEI